VSRPPLKLKVKNCVRKRRYSDELSARAGASISLRGMGKGYIYVYQCPECRGWHLTSKPNKNLVLVDNPYVEHPNNENVDRR
jgi:hypothetical protein